MSDFITFMIYMFALFFIGVGNAVVFFHILRYRDPGDVSAVVLVIYSILALVILLGTAFLVNWSAVFANAPF